MEEKKDKAVWLRRFVMFGIVSVVCAVLIVIGSHF